MTKTKIISGMAFHVHHDVLFEYCHNYQERVDYINKEKPEHERKTRIKLFAMLTQEQIAMLPKEYDEARQKYNEASQKYKPQLEEIHKKICGCKEWDGTELVFPK